MEEDQQEDEVLCIDSDDDKSLQNSKEVLCGDSDSPNTPLSTSSEYNKIISPGKK